MNRCFACEVLRPVLPVGWWGTARVAICPRCKPLLTDEDSHELGLNFRLLVPEQLREEAHA